MLELDNWFYASFFVLLGSLVQTAMGFGLALVAAPALFLLDPNLVPAPLICLAFLLSILNTYSNRQSLRIGELVIAFWGRIPGTVLGIYVLLIASQGVLSLAIGSCVIIAVLLSVSSISFSPNNSSLLWAGFMSGFMGSAAAVGGPPIALVYQSQQANHVRANLSAYFLIGCALSLFAYILVDRFQQAELLKTLQLLPSLLIGYWLGRQGLKLLQQSWFRPLILCLCLGSGLLAVIYGIKNISW